MIDSLSHPSPQYRPWWTRAALVLLATVAGPGAGPLPGGPPAGKDLYGDPLPPGAVARLGTVRFRHPSWGIIGLAVTRDDKTVVSAGEDRNVCFWEIDTGRLLRRFDSGDLHARSFALSPDGQLVALAGFRLIDNTRPSISAIQFRNATTGKVVWSIEVKDERLDSCTLVFSPDGKLLAAMSGDGIVRLLEVATGTEVLREKFPRDYAGPLVFSRDGAMLAVATGPNARKVFVWEWQAGKAPREVPVKPRGARSLDFSADGKTLATGDDGQEGIRLWDVATGRLVRQFANDGDWDMIRVRYTPDGRLLVSSSYRSPALVFWNPHTGKQVRRIDLPKGRGGRATFTPDGRRLVTTSGDGAIHVFDAATGKELSAGRAAHRQAPSFVALRSDGTAVTAGDDGTVRFWDAGTGKQHRVIEVGPEWVRAAAISPDGQWLATSELGQAHAVRLWDMRTGKQVYRLAGHGRLGGRRNLAFTADGKQLLSWGDDLYLRRWDIRTGKAVAEHRIVPKGVVAPDEDDDVAGMKGLMGSLEGAFSPGGSLLVVHGQGLAVFDTKTTREKIRIPWEDGSIAGMAVSPDEKYLLISGWGAYKQVKLPDGRWRSFADGRVVNLFDLATGKRLHRLVLSKDGGISSPAFSADSKRFAVGMDTPARILLFDTATGKPAGTIEGVPTAARSLGFSPDSKRLIGGLRDTTAVIWELEKAVKK